MSNIWHLTHQIPLFKPHEVFQMCQNFATCYSTVSNLRRYEHQCQKYFGLFNTFLSPPIKYLFLHLQHISLSLSLSLSLWFSHRQSHHDTPLTTTPCHADLITPLTTTSHHADLCLVHRCKFVLVDGNLFDLVDVGLCRWWV